MNNYWPSYRRRLAEAIEAAEAHGQDGPLTIEDALQTLCQWTRTVKENRRTIHLVGNGASACMASHLATDWSKNAAVKALAYNDIALLTALGNDLGYDQVFAQPIEWFGEKGDLLVTISSSGKSKSILHAITSARKQGLKVVTFSGMSPDNGSRAAGDMNFFVPAWTYGIVESAHHILLHAWLDCFMDVRDWEKSSS